ncbi:MAG: ribonuclease P protein component [Candidatus Moranbacteria bacterium]|nr:ribonuclease P protein component [Candidatus Moranbacteria bacterium]
MLSHKNRLIKRGDFEAVYRQGRPLFCGIIGIKARNNLIGATRIGVSVGIKFSKIAVNRNRIKRQIREIFRKNIDSVKKGLDVVVFIKKDGKEKLESGELEEMIVCALKKGKLIQ